MEDSAMTVGQVVKFRSPETAAEATERFRIVELRGDRVLVSPAAPDMAIIPTFVYLAADLEPADPRFIFDRDMMGMQILRRVE